MLIDEMTLQLTAGDGGAGASSFTKVKLNLGPSGGDGANGGSIYLEGVVDIAALGLLSNKKEIKAKNGGNGGNYFTDGHRGEDLFVKVPAGTILTRLDTGESHEIAAHGERFLAVRGGRGGRGNYKFRSSTNTSPKEFERGTKGESAAFKLELRLIADVGLIGLPNAGKSSLLNELTEAKAKVANYPFTTLEPNLGSYYGTILADIPGLIEGASSGKGLGVKFLRHIERTALFFHLVSAESDDVVRDYQTVRTELKLYDPKLAKKREIVFLSKCDTVTAEDLTVKIQQLKKIEVAATPFSLLEPSTLEPIRTILNDIRGSK